MEDDWLEVTQKCSRYGNSNMSKGRILVTVSDIILCVITNVRDGKATDRVNDQVLLNGSFTTVKTRTMDMLVSQVNEDTLPSSRAIFSRLRRGFRNPKPPLPIPIDQCLFSCFITNMYIIVFCTE